MQDRLRVGTRVRIKPAAEIVATLDAQGRRAGLPFTPEMLPFCGGVYVVETCVNRVYVEGDSVRGIQDVVILTGVRCDGAAHGACGRACHLLWHTAWLDTTIGTGVVMAEQPALPAGPCQGVGAVLREATYPLPWWHAGQYLDEVSTGSRDVGGLLALGAAALGKQARWYAGKLRRPPAAAPTPVLPPPLRLQPGEWVEIRSWPEIAATLDQRGACRGMSFTQGMRDFCGRRARVHARVTSLVSEITGRQHRIADTVLLEDIFCDGRLFRGCPRACYWCWREAWLQRVAP
jgi:hypothetical protein